MTETLFIRLLNNDDKGPALAERIASLRESGAADDVYVVDPESFRQVPNTPFCYWVSERIRRLFKELPPFESGGRTVKQGLATADDFRFVRAWWEVPAERILDSMRYAVGGRQEKQEEKWTEERIRKFQEWCRKRTYEGKRWVPFAKGGEYSPYYADIHLVVNWEKEGVEMKAFSGSVIRNTDYYFRPGLTWPRSTVKGLNMRVLPGGCVFADKGPAGFSPELLTLLSFIGLFNSGCYQLLLALQQGSRAWEVGTIQKTTVPLSGINPELHEHTFRNWFLKVALDMFEDCSHVFIFPLLLRNQQAALAERAAACGKHIDETEAELLRIQSESDEMAFRLYGFTEEERKAVFGIQYTEGSENYNEGDEDDIGAADEENASSSSPYRLQHTANLVSWCVGVAFGRWDIRIAIDPSLAPKLPDPFDPLPVCPPGMLVGPDGLPAEPDGIVSEEWLRARPDANTLPPDGSVKTPTIPDLEYPLRISWDGVLVDDAGGFSGQWSVGSGQPHKDDIVRRVREVLDLLWKDKAHEIEQEACDILGVSDLRDYFRKPAGFFQDHLKRYSKSRRKAPIYWPLSTASGSYTVWLYYHRLTDQTLYMVVNKYVEPKIEEVQKAVDSMQYAAEARERGITENQPTAYRLLPTSQLRRQLDDARAFLGELRDLREELLRIAALPYKPDLNDGVIINASPFHNLFRLRPWAKDTEDCWKKLQKGDYDWAPLAYTIWPERVREVCKRDRSIAIAHGLEDLCEVEDPEPKKRSGRGRRKREAAR